MFCFDLDSLFARKNPLGVIEAFKMAFPSGGGPRLVVKSINGDRHVEQADSIRDALAGRSDIEYRDGYLPAGDQKAFINACDAYVSLHRSEGFGLTMAEAMALGKPVVATAYSGNLDFMNDNNSFLVPFEYAEIGPGSEPYPADAVWAEPDIDAAARAMRRVFEDRDEAQRRAHRAVRDIESFHSPAVRARFIVDRVRRVREELAQRQLAPAPDLCALPDAKSAQSGVPAEKMAELNTLIADIAGLITAGPQVGAKTVVPFGRQLRLLMLRLNRNFYLHQQQVNGAMIGAISDLAALHSSSVDGSEREAPEEGEAASASSSAQLEAVARITDETAEECERRFGSDAADVARDLRLLAARVRGLVK